MAIRFTILQHARPTRTGQPTQRALPFRTVAASTLVVFLLLPLFGCSGRSSGPSVEMPPTPILSLRPMWAVVTEPYIRLRVGPTREAAISGHLRRGDVAAIEAVSPVVERSGGERLFWYRLENAEAGGWVLSDVLEAYTSEDRARNAAGRLGG